MALQAALLGASGSLLPQLCTPALGRLVAPFLNTAHRPASTLQQQRLSHSDTQKQQPSQSGEQHEDNKSAGQAAAVTCYEGFFAANHRRLKVASLVNTAVSLGACPAIVYLSDASPVARALVAVSVIGFGLGTTLGLHWFTSPYVHELQWVTRPAGDAGDPSDTAGEAPSGRLRAKTLSLLGRQRWTEFELREVAHPDSMRPLATFKARGRFYYIDKGSLTDEQLLRWLTPEHPAAAEMERMQQQQQAQEE